MLSNVVSVCKQYLVIDFQNFNFFQAFVFFSLFPIFFLTFLNDVPCPFRVFACDAGPASDGEGKGEEGTLLANNINPPDNWPPIFFKNSKQLKL